MRPLNADSLYGSVLVLHPDGTPMFRCAKKRADWYLKRKLAVTKPDGAVQLLFEPKGHGHSGDAFYLEEKDSVCVSCGSDQRLTKHHCVPYCYRRFFPEKVKTRDHHDVVLLCDDCHRTYEERALPLKKELADKFNDPMSWATVNRPLARIKGHAAAIVRHTAGEFNIPDARLTELRQEVAAFLGHDPTAEELDNLSQSNIMTGMQPHGFIVVDKHRDDLQGFIIMWRRHFIETMQPKFLSKHWKIERQARCA